jgi:opacity protein-like surface antigen
MMKKRSVLILAAFAFLAFAIPAQAQTTLYIGAGGSFPTGDFADYANTGWMGVGGVVFGLGDGGFGVGGEVFYGQNNHGTDEFELDSKTTPYGIMAIADYTFGSPDGLQPYVFGGAGLMVHKFSGDGFESDSESGFGYQFGAGLSFNFGLFIEGRYMGSSNMGEGDFAEATTYFGALAGWAFSL